MPARKQQARHWYTVWVNGETDTRMAYSGSSETAARTAFAKAVMQNVHAVSVEIRRDFKPWLRVLIERQP